MHHFDIYHVRSEEQTAQQRRVFNESKNQLEADIYKERTRLLKWLEYNTAIAHHGLVQAIYDEYFPKESHPVNESLDIYRARLNDLHAVNLAIHGGGIDDLQMRANENMESKSIGLQFTGILLGCLSLTLILCGLIILNPVVVYSGIMAGLAAFAVCDVGATKVSTTKSTLFANLKEAISPSPIVLNESRIDDANFALSQYELSMYGLHK